MSAFAIAVIHETRFGPDIQRYLEEIDATLAPFSGRFRVHGGPYDVLEGAWGSDVVVIEFPALALAHAWYASPAYASIRPLRTGSTTGALFIVEGVSDSHRAIDLLNNT